MVVKKQPRAVNTIKSENISDDERTNRRNELLRKRYEIYIFRQVRNLPLGGHGPPLNLGKRRGVCYNLQAYESKLDGEYWMEKFCWA